MKQVLITLIYTLEEYLVTPSAQHSAADLHKLSVSDLKRMHNNLVAIFNDILE